MQTSMEFIKCRKIADGYYSSADTEIDCDGDYYKEVIFPTNLAILLVFGILIPGIAAVKLF